MKLKCGLIKPNRSCIKQIIKPVLFMGILIVILLALQKVMIPKWNYPYHSNYITKTIDEFYDQDNDSIDVLFFGASNCMCGVCPMELYEEKNIVSYNLATAGQPVYVSFYLLKEALKYQSPRVVVLDVSSMMFTASNSYHGRMIMDIMPFSLNKLDFAKAYVEVNGKPDELISAVFPLINYHTRWTELSENDFSRSDYLYCNYGFFLSSQINPCLTTMEEMNQIAVSMELDQSAEVYHNVNGNLLYAETEDLLDDLTINETSKRYLLEMKKLCEEQNIEFLMIHIPGIGTPSLESYAWTRQKYEMIRQLADDNVIEYVDLLYDVQIPYDWKTDTQDGGHHFNIWGAEKSTAFLAEFLKNNYQIPEVKNEQMEYDKAVYKKVRNIAVLQMETDLENYVKGMSENSGRLYFIVAKDEATSGLSETEKETLHKAGLITDFENGYRNSYVAIVDSDKVVFEECSNRKIETKYQAADGAVADLMSEGFLCGSDCSIEINGQNYALNNRGMNIVVYDIETGQIIDSVSFDTCVEEHRGERNAVYKEKELRYYEMFWFDNLLNVKIGE